ncbi:MAG: PD-(D/E)XK nuclease family protein [Oscillospiraceae bacterium]|nr:PD-(D/E)XK nuclease family protein [Oscillospiraceae bacterium]
MLNLIIGRSGTGKSTLVLERMCKQGQGQNILLVPDPQSHETERRLCQQGGAGVSLYAEVLTFSRLANRVFQTAGGLGRRELDGGGRLLLMYRAAQSVAGRLKVYARPSRRPAFLTGLLDTADELKSCCIPPERLCAVGEEIGGNDGDRLWDLGLICGAYDAMTANIALDPRDRLTRAAQKLADCRWAQGNRFYLDGFIDFTPQQMEIIRLLLQQGDCVTVALTCDHLNEDEDGAGIFSAARRTAAQLRRMAQEMGHSCTVEVCEQPAPGRSDAMTAVETRLFGQLAGKRVPCGDDVQLFCAPDARTEVEWTAAKILELVRDKGLRYRDIGVVARSYDRYDGLVESVFDRYGIPVFRSAMSDILQKPVLTLMCAALDAVSGGYSYDDMFRYLKTDLTDVSREERDILENYVLKWDIRGRKWTQESPWVMHPRGYGFAMEDADRELLDKLDSLRRRVAAPLERLRTERDRTGRGQASALYAFLEEIGLSARLEERCDRLRQQGQLGLAQEYRQLWEILCGGLEQCARLLDDCHVEPDEFSKLLRLVLSQYEVGTIPVSLDRVAAGEMVRQSGHGVKVLFLLGADDNSIPAVNQTARLLSDDDRELLAAYGMELGLRGKDRLYREMTAVYTACTCPDRMLIVTWPCRNGSEELQPSFLVERLRRIFPDLVTQEEGDGSFRLAAPRAALERAGDVAEVRRALEQMPQWRPQVERMERAARWERGSLSREAVDRLYGKRVPMSASRMDKYKSCHFSYFMRYGLKAEPRRSAGFDAPEYGTFVHYVMEHVFREDSWRGGDGGIDTAALKELTRRAVERYVQEELGGLAHQSARFVYLFRRLAAGVDQVVENVAQELAASRFVPLDFELGFGRGQELPPVELTGDGVTVSVTGFVDRVDGWEKDGKLYLRVVDYKTGKKTFDLTEVANGMGLQMLLYLFALQHMGEERYGKSVVPAGVMYLPAREVTVSGSLGMTEAERKKLVDKQLRRHGLVLDDPQVLQAMERPGEEGIRFLPVKLTKSGLSGDGLVTARRFARLERHVERVLRDICSEIAAGNIAADPFWRGQDRNACRFCDYAAACHFEEGRGGDCRRWLSGVKAEEFWQQVAKDGPGDEEADPEEKEGNEHEQ